MKKLILVLILTLASFTAEARGGGGGGSNALSLELGGRAGLYSLNLDHLFADSFALGVGVANWSSGVYSTTIIPVYLDIYFAGNSLYFTAGDTFYSGSLGTGTSFTSSSAANIGLGYEYRGGFLFRLAVYYLLGNSASSLWGGLSLGFTF